MLDLDHVHMGKFSSVCSMREHRGKTSIVRSLLCSLHSLHSLSENLTFTSDENN